MASNKGRVLFLLRYLREYTDEEHPVTTNDLVELYAKEGYSGNRKTVKDDIDELNKQGFDVAESKGCGNGNVTSYCYVGRDFDIPEIQMLLNAVASARFISESRSNDLIRKLTGLASANYRDALSANIYVPERIKTANNQLFLILDVISQAVSQKKKIRFQYYDYNLKKEKVLHNNGEYYTYSPYCCTWDGDRYYVLGRVDKRPDVINPFRVDLMCLPELLDEDALPVPDDFHPAEYSEHVFKMFGGNEETVSLIADNSFMKKFIDRFGEDFPVKSVSPTEFCADVHVEVSKTFFAWVDQYEGKVRIAAPERIRKDYIEHLEKLMEGTKQLK